MMRRHILICRSAAGADLFQVAAFDGARWHNESQPRQLASILDHLPQLLVQIETQDFTISPFRGFDEFDRAPCDFSLPEGRPVLLACPTEAGGNCWNHWGWLAWHDASQPPAIVSEPFILAGLQGAIAQQLRLHRPDSPWNADRELWVRHDLTRADLLPEGAAA